MCHYIVSDLPHYLFQLQALVSNLGKEEQSLLHIKLQWGFYSSSLHVVFQVSWRLLGELNSFYGQSLEFLMCLPFSFRKCPTRASEGLKILWKSLILSVSKSRGGSLCSRFLRPGCVQRWTAFVLHLPYSKDYRGEFFIPAVDWANGAFHGSVPTWTPLAFLVTQTFSPKLAIGKV